MHNMNLYISQGILDVYIQFLHQPDQNQVQQYYKLMLFKILVLGQLACISIILLGIGILTTIGLVTLSSKTWADDVKKWILDLTQTQSQLMRRVLSKTMGLQTKRNQFCNFLVVMDSNLDISRSLLQLYRRLQPYVKLKHILMEVVLITIQQHQRSRRSSPRSSYPL